MAWLSGLAALLLGAFAVLLALRTKRSLAARLGRTWRLRFLAVQALLINLSLFWVVKTVANQLGWSSGPALWVLPLGYGILFFFYSLSNIDWTARKFHGIED